MPRRNARRSRASARGPGADVEPEVEDRELGVAAHLVAGDGRRRSRAAPARSRWPPCDKSSCTRAADVCGMQHERQRVDGRPSLGCAVVRLQRDRVARLPALEAEGAGPERGASERGARALRLLARARSRAPAPTAGSGTARTARRAGSRSRAGPSTRMPATSFASPSRRVAGARRSTDSISGYEPPVSAASRRVSVPATSLGLDLAAVVEARRRQQERVGPAVGRDRPGAGERGPQVERRVALDEPREDARDAPRSRWRCVARAGSSEEGSLIAVRRTIDPARRRRAHGPRHADGHGRGAGREGGDRQGNREGAARHGALILLSVVRLLSARAPSVLLASMPSLHDLPTPAVLVDLDVLERNVQRMAAARAAARRAAAAPRQDAQDRGHRAPAGRAPAPPGSRSPRRPRPRSSPTPGFDDLFVAYPVVGAGQGPAAARARRARAAGGRRRQRRGRAHAGRACSPAPAARSTLMLKVDVGYHRVGVAPERGGGGGARRSRTCPACALRGVFTHAGHAYAAETPEGVDAVAGARGPDARALRRGAARGRARPSTRSRSARRRPRARRWRSRASPSAARATTSSTTRRRSRSAPASSRTAR